MPAKPVKPPWAPSSEPRQSSGLRGIDLFISVCLAFAFAIAQPLYDLLGRGADFFVARRSAPVDPVLLALALSLIAPLVVGGVILLIRLVRPRFALLLHAMVLGGLAGLFLLQLLKRLPTLDTASGAVLIVGALCLGTLVVLTYYRYRGVRFFFRVASPAIALFPILFLFASPVRVVVFPTSSAGESGAAIERPMPIAFVVFDEFPVTSLMAADGEIDHSLYPNFARLAREGTWFRNATTVHSQTKEAVPALLSGRYPKPGSRLPILAEHPRNLFTFLGRRYDVRAVETYTDLCPRNVCRSLAEPPLSFGPRWRSLIADLRLAAMHVFLPNDLTKEVPAVDETLGNFADQGGVEGGTDPRGNKRGELVEDSKGQRHGGKPSVASRDNRVERFLASVGPSARPPLFYLHVLLPHRPFFYLPAGRRYRCDTNVGREGPGWGADDWAVTHQYQRHLLQAAYADYILGRLYSRLERAGLYDETLVVVASDHGAVFRPNVASPRILQRDTIPWIAPVPLFVKAPGHLKRGIDDRPVELIDVLPTIADILKTKRPWRTDGSSLLQPRAPRRHYKRIYSGAPVGLEQSDSPDLRRWYRFGVSGREKDVVLRQKTSAFGRGLFRAAPRGYSGVLERKLTSLHIAGRVPYTADVEQLAELRRVDLRARRLPLCISGRLRPRLPRRAYLGVALNGKVRAVTTTYQGGRFAAMIPPEALRSGRNDLEVLLLRRNGAVASPLPMR
jgi:hypothetical protein